MDELRIAMTIYMQYPEACKAAIACGSKIAQHVEDVVGKLADFQQQQSMTLEQAAQAER